MRLRMATSLLLSSLLSLLCIDCSTAFEIPVHKQITQELEDEAVSDGMELVTFAQYALDEVKSANARVDYTGFAFDFWHFDNEMLTKGSQKILDDLKDARDYLLEDPPDGEDARDKFGAAVHTLQDFYAHSNWADINTADDIINTNLGVRTIPNPPDKVFCTPSGELLSGNTDITTGYFEATLRDFDGPGPLPPLPYCPPTPPGKCHHGLKGITSLPFCPFRPGINKDDATRDVHARAYAQGLKASRELLKELLSSPGIANNKKRIRAFFGRKSLAVVIDTTGSMGNDIASVRRAVARIANNPSIVEELTPTYILVGFNDPAVGPVVRTTDVGVFLSAVNSLSTFGGGDCPEYSMSGQLRAIKESDPKSTLLLFTDASPKDASLAPLVFTEARRKQIRINPILTGTCSPVDPTYIQLAEETGGQLFFVPRNDVEKVFDVIDKQLRTDFVTVCRTRLIIDGTVSLPVSIDDTLETAIFSSSIFEGVITSIDIIRPDGTLVRDSDPNVTFSDLGDNSIVTVIEPIAGEWTINVTGTGPLTSTVEGNSPLNFDFFQFVSLVNGRYEQMFLPKPGNPVADGTSEIALGRVTGPAMSSTFEIVDRGGTIIPMAVEDEDNELLAAPDETILNITIPAEAFSVISKGLTVAGNAFQRLFPSVFTPQTIKVTFDDTSRPNAVPKGVDTVIRFILENFGNESATVDVIVSDDKSYLRSWQPSQVTISPSSSEFINVTLSPTTCVEGDTVRVTTAATIIGETLGNSDFVDIAVFCDIPTSEPSSQPSSAPSSQPSQCPSEEAYISNYWVPPLDKPGISCENKRLKIPEHGEYTCMSVGEGICRDNGGYFGEWRFGVEEVDRPLCNFTGICPQPDEFEPKNTFPVLIDPGTTRYPLTGTTYKDQSTGKICRNENGEAVRGCNYAGTTHICIGENIEADPKKYSNERPYMFFYNEKTHKFLYQLVCDGVGTEDKLPELKMVNNEEYAHEQYVDYPVDIVKFKKGSTPNPDDANELWKMFVDWNGYKDSITMRVGQLGAYINVVHPKLCKEYVSPTSLACWTEDCDSAPIATPKAYEVADCGIIG